MNQEEKTELTKERIIQGAMKEFGTNGYDGTTLNSICKEYGISKGLFYHNFNGKDDVYLICVERCFEYMTTYFKEMDIKDDLKKYMEIRYLYFSEHPIIARIFFEALLQPPKNLIKEIKDKKKDFDLLNREIYSSALSHITLRPGITESDALEYYEMIQEMFNGYFSSPAYANKGFEEMITYHEEILSKMMNFMLYGIAERGTEK